MSSYRKAVGAYLTGADLRNAYLELVNLRGAVLVGADLRESHLRGVISWANLTDADLTGATGLDTAPAVWLENVIWSNTTCPDGTNSDANGGTCQGHF